MNVRGIVVHGRLSNLGQNQINVGKSIFFKGLMLALLLQLRAPKQI